MKKLQQSVADSAVAVVAPAAPAVHTALDVLQALRDVGMDIPMPRDADNTDALPDSSECLGLGEDGAGSRVEDNEPAFSFDSFFGHRGSGGCASSGGSAGHAAAATGALSRQKPTA